MLSLARDLSALAAICLNPVRRRTGCRPAPFPFVHRMGHRLCVSAFQIGHEIPVEFETGPAVFDEEPPHILGVFVVSIDRGGEIDFPRMPVEALHHVPPWPYAFTPLQIAQPTSHATTTQAMNRHAGACTRPGVPAGSTRLPVTIGAIRLSRFTSR